MNRNLIRIVTVSCVAGGFALAATPAQAGHRYRSRCGPAVVGPPVVYPSVLARPLYRAPAYAYCAPVPVCQPVYAVPACPPPIYAAPVYAAPVYSAPVYAAPVYWGSGVGFRFSYSRDRGYQRAYYPRSSRGFYRCR
jgi:hypothetical protein